MTETFDPVTSALTGHLTFHLLLAAALTWPIAFALLRVYTRTVRRSMSSHAQPTAASPPEGPASGAAATPAEGHPATLHDLPAAAPASGGAVSLLARLIERPRQAALIYAAGGTAYGLVMTASQHMADGLEVLPVRFLFLFWMFLWPVVPTTCMVAGSTRWARSIPVAGYFLVLTAIGLVIRRWSPELTWVQVFTPWVLSNLPGTILLLTYLSRRIRAVGPLVLTFMLLALIGSDVAVTLVGTRESYLRAMLNVTRFVGLGGTGTFFSLLAVGFLMFAVIGAVALVWIGRRYQAKKISDESVAVDALWMLFAVIHSVGLVFSHPAWALAGVAGLAAYKVCVRIGFAWLSRRDGPPQHTPALLVLRSFSIGSASERLFDIIGRHWRRVGSIQMIAGVDLASRTVEPHEFLDLVSGRLSRRFIDGEESLNRRMRERDVAPDRDLRFRVNEFFCYDNTWRMVLSRLVDGSDAVLMDLRGFSRQNAGCVFELRELTRLVPLDRVVFVVDGRTDEGLLAETLGDCLAGVFRAGGMDGQRVRELLRALAVAAAPASPSPV
ncbi:MAG: hypothetical protein M3Q38_08545 [Chloroflexota bacterium]|nr:hypothetical protein [Chloroflexota bacterium]